MVFCVLNGRDGRTSRGSSDKLEGCAQQNRSVCVQFVKRVAEHTECKAAKEQRAQQIGKDQRMSKTILLMAEQTNEAQTVVRRYADGKRFEEGCMPNAKSGT